MKLTCGKLIKRFSENIMKVTSGKLIKRFSYVSKKNNIQGVRLLLQVF